MISGNSSDSNNQTIQRNPRDLYDDNHLGRLFINANRRALNTVDAEIFDIYQEKDEVYTHSAHAPTDELREKILRSVGDTKVFHDKLIDVHREYGFFNQIKYHANKLIYKDGFSNLAKTEQLVGLDWTFYRKYKKLYKEHNKKYRDDFSTHCELFFKNKKNLKKTIFYEIWMLCLGLWCAMTIFLLLNFVNHAGDLSMPLNAFVQYFKNAITYATVIALVALLFPYCLLLIMWFNNIARLHCSKNFHFFLIGSTMFAYLFITTSFFSIGIFHLLQYLFDFYPIL